MSNFIQNVTLFLLKLIFGIFIGCISGFGFKYLLKFLIFCFNYLIFVHTIIYGLIFYVIYFIWLNYYEIKIFFIGLKEKLVGYFKSFQKFISDTFKSGEDKIKSSFKFRSNTKS